MHDLNVHCTWEGGDRRFKEFRRGYQVTAVNMVCIKTRDLCFNSVVKRTELQMKPSWVFVNALTTQYSLNSFQSIRQCNAMLHNHFRKLVRSDSSSLPGVDVSACSHLRSSPGLSPLSSQNPRKVVLIHKVPLLLAFLARNCPYVLFLVFC